MTELPVLVVVITWDNLYLSIGRVFCPSPDTWQRGLWREKPKSGLSNIRKLQREKEAFLCDERKQNQNRSVSHHYISFIDPNAQQGYKVQKANACVYSSYNREETKASAGIATQGVAKGETAEKGKNHLYLAAPTENVEVRAGIPGGNHTWKVWGVRQEEMSPSFFSLQGRRNNEHTTAEMADSILGQRHPFC